MGVKLSDIAKAANVAPSTVSRVIADSPKISQETKERVQKIMKEMDYHPHVAARSLANQSTNIIGVVLPNTAEKMLAHPFYPEILRGIGAAAQEYKYSILLSNTDESDENRVINQFVNGGIVDGIILMTSKVKDPYIDNLMRHKHPFVVVGRPEYENRINWVDNDNVYAAYELTDFFIQKGHQRILFYGLTSQFVVSIDRLEGYKEALERNKIEYQPELIVTQEEIDAPDHKQKLLALMKKYKPTGIIVMDDFLAYKLMKKLNENGYTVPEKVSVAGFNNIYMSNYSVPGLTSVEVNPYLLGVEAFKLLRSTIKKPTEAKNRVIVPTKVIERESVVKN